MDNADVTSSTYRSSTVSSTPKNLYITDSPQNYWRASVSIHSQTSRSNYRPHFQIILYLLPLKHSANMLLPRQHCVQLVNLFTIYLVYQIRPVDSQTSFAPHDLKVLIYLNIALQFLNSHFENSQKKAVDEDLKEFYDKLLYDLFIFAGAVHLLDIGSMYTAVFLGLFAIAKFLISAQITREQRQKAEDEIAAVDYGTKKAWDWMSSGDGIEDWGLLFKQGE